MAPWRTAIVDADASDIRIRGHRSIDLMRRGSLVDVICLLHRGDLPKPAERRLIEAVMIGISDHGAGAPSCAAGRMVASSNRQSVAAAVGAGVLAIGDEHGGAGAPCMELIAACAEQVRKGRTMKQAAAAAVDEALASGRRLPGFGHRMHREKDPRVDFLHRLARRSELAGDGWRTIFALEKELSRRVKPLPANIDAALAAILHDLGFPPAAARYIFIIARVTGITAEVAEEYAREKPMRVKIPVVYDGERPRQRKASRKKAGK